MTKLMPTRVAARLKLRPSSDGGLARPWETPTPSFWIVIGDLTLGAYIYSMGARPLTPGDSYRNVELLFWAPVARDVAKPGTSFLLVYVDRTIGEGEIMSLLGFA